LLAHGAGCHLLPLLLLHQQQASRSLLSCCQQLLQVLQISCSSQHPLLLQLQQQLHHCPHTHPAAAH
jgi:hypothetical protein